MQLSLDTMLGKKPDKCKVCLLRNVKPEHYESEKHKQNCCLKKYTVNKSHFTANRLKVASLYCEVTSSTASTNSREGKIKVSVKPDETVEFKFTLSNDSKMNSLEVIAVDLVHSELNFEIPNNPYKPGNEPHIIAPRTKLPDKVVVSFKSPHIGQYETPILFKLKQKDASNETIALMRDMVVYVEETVSLHDKIISPYEKKPVWAKQLLRSPHKEESDEMFPIPKSCKLIFANNLQVAGKATELDKELAADIRKTLEVGITKENYVKFFHNLLWYEETIIRVNIKNYNMSGVTLKIQATPNHGIVYALTIPGLSEKRPSVMIGDLLFLRHHNHNDVMFEAIVKEVTENVAYVGGLHANFGSGYSLTALYDIRFFMSRISLERMHKAVHEIRDNGHYPRIFPTRNTHDVKVESILNYFNPLVEENEEQRCAVERIVAGTSGTAPYLVHGPPGTGKTITIVEAVLQLAIRPAKTRILICTDSNMAADHVACMLIKYKHMFPKDKWLLRANSKFRNWDTLPECLYKFSNGINRQRFVNVSLDDFIKYTIVITTLSHAAKFGRHMFHRRMGNHVSHLFIDEAAQASEPASLIPVCALLKQSGTLVLAGDPHQLGPVVISRTAARIGLGTSLMERLMKTNDLYSDDEKKPDYVVMLRDNFRSHPDILEIPDKLFYKGQLRACAEKDPLSTIDVLGEKETSRAIVFHGVLSKEEKMGKSPSYFNMMECEMVQQYVKRLVQVHNVSACDIGVVTPYIRQVYQIRKSLQECGIRKIDVGTVEGYQGQEKRVVIISTVRANCDLLEYDAKFQLGFLVDDKRFNVAITRAKAKVIIIGNPLCLEKDVKWRMYMDRCRELGTYHGFDSKHIMSNGSGQQIVNKLAPLLKGMSISVRKPKK
ncbi:putative helicase mov-10-B.1 [Spodoptera litura]|uniref:RNA helicase n=1 Tax=Spodoptera litura TaxID=69820 RepID=A0A9J7DS89_SPOLT|nr:putative helicase mov-10-B.1 [Spodoptera litura]